MHAKYLLPLDTNTSQAITDDINKAYELLDLAMAHTLRTTATLIETGQKVGLDPKSGQKLFTGLAATTDAIIESRKNLITAHQQAHVIRMRSTSAGARMVGCPWPFSADDKAPVKLEAVA